MARRSISWILEFTSKLPTTKEKVECLRQNDNSAIRTILKFALDPKIEWLLPEGEPPYTPYDFGGGEPRLYGEARRLYLFVKGGNDNLNQIRREALFVSILEDVDPEDAKLLLAIKDKKLPFKGLNRKIVEEAYPGIFE